MKTGLEVIALCLSTTLLSLTIPATATGQVSVYSSDDCRCVDKDGKEIDNCICYRVPDRSLVTWQASPSHHPEHE